MSTRAVGDRSAATALLEERLAWVLRHREQLPFVPQSYTRTLVAASDGYEIVAMVWAPGIVTPIHDHGDSHCATLLVDGALRSERFALVDADDTHARLVAEGEHVLRAGDLEWLQDARELHRVATASERPALALHLYAVPLGAYRCIDERDGTVREARSAYDFVLTR
jgi:predicted metal-dependent enzyme (double-stranded beta helix superfamily)